MSETTWGTETEAPRKRSIPTWLWFCGGGCLLAIVLGVVIIGWGIQKGVEFVKEGSNPEVQWPKVANLLPFDERPPELTLKWGSTLGFDMFVFDDKRGFYDLLMRLPGNNAAAERKKLFDPQERGGVFGQGAREDMSAGKIQVQGRELDTLRFEQKSAFNTTHDEPGKPKPPARGKGILVDLTPPGGDRPIVLEMIRLGGDDPILDEDVQAFLKPFHVGNKR